MQDREVTSPAVLTETLNPTARPSSSCTCAVMPNPLPDPGRLRRGASRTRSGAAALLRKRHCSPLASTARSLASLSSRSGVRAGVKVSIGLC